MKKFINIAMSLGLLLSLAGCSSVRSNDEIQIERLFEISEFSEEVIRNEWLQRLKYLEEQALNPREFPGITKDCTKFADSLLHLSRKVMAMDRNPNIISLIMNMTDRIVEVGRKVRNAFLKTDFFATSIMWYRLQIRELTIRDLEKINQITFDDSYASPKSVLDKIWEINYVKGYFYFHAIDPFRELFYDIILGNNELFKKCYEKLQKVGSYKSKNIGRVKDFLDLIKMRATEKIDKADELEIKIHQLFKINEISEDVIIKKWTPCLEALESLDLESLKPEKVAYVGSWFSRSLVNLAAKTMVGNRNPRINALILEMSSRTLKVMEKAKKAWLKANPNKEFGVKPNKELTDLAAIPWVMVSVNDHWLRSWDVVNLITYDENSPEIIENKLEKIINLIDEEFHGKYDIWYSPGDFITIYNINWDLRYRIYSLIEDFYKKLQKVGGYNRKHSKKSQMFLNVIKETVTKIEEQKEEEPILISIKDLFRTTEISDEMISKEWYPVMKILEDSKPEKVAYLCSEFSRSLKEFSLKIMATERNPKINSLTLKILSRLMKIKEKDSNKKNHHWWSSAELRCYEIRFWEVMNKIAYDDKYNSLEAVKTELSLIPSNENFNRSDSPLETYLPSELNPLIKKFHEKLKKVGGYKIKYNESVQKFLDKVQKRVQRLRKNRRKR